MTKKINGIEKDIYDYVNEKLDEIEKEFNVKVLYAVETGSRGWGFANEDSDYDIRFIYIHPIEHYLSIEKKRDVIDYQDLKDKKYKYDLDFSGWDITKALKLHRKSNPTLREHIIHKMVYRGDTSFFNGLPDFDLVTLKYHYGSMTYSNWKKYVKGEDMTPDVTKRYCYCIRQILAWILIDEYNDIDAPINFYELLDRFKNDPNNVIADQLLEDFETVIDYYKSGCKLNKLSERCIMNVSVWISQWNKVIKTKQGNTRVLPDIEIYNQRFLDILRQAIPYGLRSDIYDRCHNCVESNIYPSAKWCDESHWSDAWDDDGRNDEPTIFCEDFKPAEAYRRTRKIVGI